MCQNTIPTGASPSRGVSCHDYNPYKAEMRDTNGVVDRVCRSNNTRLSDVARRCVDSKREGAGNGAE